MQLRVRRPGRFGPFVLTLFLSSTVGASTVTWETPADATTSGPVDVMATFVTSTDTVTITVQNLQADPDNVTQNLSGLEFVLNTTPGGTSSLTTSSGQERTVNSDGTFSDGAVVPTQWGFSSTDNKLDVLGTPEAPQHTVLGPPGPGNIYSSANGSIDGSGSHNPFLVGPVSFTLNVPGITGDTTVVGATFLFGTTEGKYSVPSIVVTPEPATLGWLAIGVPALLACRRRRSVAC